MYIRSDLNWGIGLILLGAIVSSASALVRESASLNVAIVGLVVNLIGAYYWSGPTTGLRAVSASHRAKDIIPPGEWR